MSFSDFGRQNMNLNSACRIRIHIPELQESNSGCSQKLWYVIDPQVVGTVGELKRDVFRRYKISQLESSKVYLDEFEIPDFETVKIFRDNDLIVIRSVYRLRTTDIPVSSNDVPVKRKRKRRNTNEEQLLGELVTEQASDLDAAQQLPRQKRAKKQTSDNPKSKKHKSDDKLKSKSDRDKNSENSFKDDAIPPIQNLSSASPLTNLVIKNVSEGNSEIKKRKRRRKKKATLNSTPINDNCELFSPNNAETPRELELASKSTGKHTRFDDSQEVETENLLHIVTRGGNSINSHVSSQIDNSLNRDRLDFGEVERNPKRKRSKFQKNFIGSNDVLVNKSVIIENTDELPENICDKSKENNCDDVSKIDYSTCQAFEGAPRIGDVIAFKELELSATYSPEISCYKVGRVTSFDPFLKSIIVNYLNPLKVQVRTGKFELISADEEDYEAEETETFEMITEGTVTLDSMIEPKLIPVGLM